MELVIGGADGAGELVGAGSGAHTADIAEKLFLDSGDSPAVNELGDSLEVAVAAADE